MMNKEEIKEKLKENGAWCTECHTGEEDRYVKIIKAMQLIEQLDEPQKPVVPKFVADWIEYAKKKGDSLAISFKPWNLYGVEYSKADRWIEDNQETFARAWLDGYEVEKEPLYYVTLPDTDKDSGVVYALEKKRDGGIEISLVDRRKLGVSDSTKLSEQEIKSVDERYQLFAKEVAK